MALVFAILGFGGPGSAATTRPLPFPQPFAPPTPPHLTYYGGPVMTFTENAVVLWGSTGHSPTLTANLPRFIASFANAGNTNPYNVALEYHTPSQALTLASRYLGSFTIDPSTASTQLSDGDVAGELAAQIGRGALPPPRVAFGGPVTEYYVMFPAADTICVDGSCSNVQFCAYHSDGTYAGTPFAYTVLPESTPPESGCGPNTSNGGLGNLTSMASHEMVESMTDPEVGSAPALGPPLAWYDPAHGEVADICDGQDSTLTLGTDTWVVQKEWSNAENACIASHSGSGLTGVLASLGASPAGGAVGFDASATTTANGGAAVTSYAWDWGDGTSSGATSPTTTHAYDGPGTRLVTLVARDSAGASGAQFLSVTTRGLSVTAANGRVTSSPAAISCTSACSANFLDGATISLTASPAPGYAFGGWTGDCAGQGATCVVTMNAARAAGATFTSPTPTATPPPPPAAAPLSAGCIVPKLKGRTVVAARAALRASRCSLGRRSRVYSRSVRRGRIVSQSPAPGARRRVGSTVNIVVSRGRRLTRAVARRR